MVYISPCRNCRVKGDNSNKGKWSTFSCGLRVRTYKRRGKGGGSQIRKANYHPPSNCPFLFQG